MALDEKPDKINPEDGALPEVPELFQPGELAPAEGIAAQYGFRLERLPKKYQDHLKKICQLIAERDMFARIDEVKRAAEQRFYWRSMFDMYFNEKNAIWEMPGMSSYDSGDSGDVPLSYAFNIYQAFGRSFISHVGQVPYTRFDATDPSSPDALRITTAAEAMKYKIEAQNDVITLSKTVSRLMWTDGRVGLYARWVCDGARFGYEDEEPVEESPEGLGEAGTPPKKKPRQAKGGSLLDPYGVLELKLPINMRKQPDFPFLQLSYEIDLTTAKSMYPHISQTISGGEPGPGEYNFDRTTRIACTQGVRLLTQTGDTVHQLPTYQRTWMRPTMFAEIEDETDRQFFYDNFPNGAFVAFIGDTYAESRNESMDDHWDVIYPIDGDGQTTPSWGYPLMSVQDAINDLTDLQMETAMKAIPAIYMDKLLFDLQAFAKQKTGPGAHFPLKNVTPQTVVSNHVWAEPKVEMTASSIELYNQLLTVIPQLLTGIYPSAQGDADPNNETKGGILALMDASKSQLGTAFTAWKMGYASSMEKLVRIEAYYKEAEAEEGKVHVGSPGHQEVEVELEDLREGNCYCVPDSDQNIPETFEDQQRAWLGWNNAAMQGYQPAMLVVTDPNNRAIAKKFGGVHGMAMPGSDETQKQLNEIEEMLQVAPVPNQQAIDAYRLALVASRITGQNPPPEPPVEQLYGPSVKIDPQTDKHEIEAPVCQAWINGPKGQQAKRNNPEGFLNVKLHFLAHSAELKKQADNQAAQAIKSAGAMEGAKAIGKAAGEKPKSPSESIAFKDLGPSGQLQVAKQAGLDITSDVAGSIAAEQGQQGQQGQPGQPGQEGQPGQPGQ